MRDWINNYVREQVSALEQVDPKEIERLILEIKELRGHGAVVYVAGNGGSAANASHFVTDLSKGASDALGDSSIDGRFRAHCLSDNVPWITALGNDYSYHRIFSEQLKTLARPCDMLIGVSVSGTSPNLVEAFKFARSRGMTTVCLVGKKAVEQLGSIYNLSDFRLPVDSEHYGRVEDVSMTILHMICYYFMENKEECLGT